LAVSLAILMAVTTLPMGLAQAKMVTTDQVIEQSSPSDDRERVRDFLAREDVQDQLALLGVDPDEAASRVDSLLIIFLVLLITDLLGLTDVFPFVKK
jgi:hypothetical protein